MRVATVRAMPQKVPPRPIAPGDIVTVFSRFLGEWTAAQITHLDSRAALATVLELDWSGPEPRSVAELGDVRPLRRTHHSWNGALAQCNFEWVLPRSYRVLGSLPLLHEEPCSSYGHGWGVGRQLAIQRQWDAGNRESWTDPAALECTAEDLIRAFDGPPRPELRQLRVAAIESLDCARLVRHCPQLTQLDLSGRLGLLHSASSLNGLGSLKRLRISGLFGMTGDDSLLPRHVPGLEALELHTIPAEYAAASRKVWRPEIPQGVFLDVRAARNPEWVAENRSNPLRDWDGRNGISGAKYKKAVAQYKATRRAVLAALAEGADAVRFTEIGQEYGEAFNKLDGRVPFIETVEREELYDVLAAIVTDAETSQGRDFAWAKESLASGVDDVRDW